MSRQKVHFHHCSLWIAMKSDPEISVTHSNRQFRLKLLPSDADINTQLHSDTSIELYQPIFPYLLHDLPLQTPSLDLLPGWKRRQGQRQSEDTRSQDQA